MAVVRLTITYEQYMDCLRHTARNPGAAITRSVGVNRTTAGTEWLLPAKTFGRTTSSSAGRAAFVGFTHELPAGVALQQASAQVMNDANPTVLVGLGVGPLEGQFAILPEPAVGSNPAIRSLRIVGPGLPVVDFGVSSTTSEASTDDTWSRTIGALGGDAYRRLIDLHIGIIGAGRTGSLAAVSLRRLGVKTLTAIDADSVEPHNLGEADGLDRRSLHQTKAKALATALQALDLNNDATIAWVTESILSLRALLAAKACDAFFCCVDAAEARLVSTFLAAIYTKPLIDIGAGVFSRRGHDHREMREMGADVRLILPGHCLCCLGGIAGMDRARMALLKPDQASAFSVPWQQQRAGSLRSLNGIAVNLGIRLLEDLVAGPIRSSTWLHLEYDHGIPTITQPATPSTNICPVCSLAGCGDSALGLLRDVLEKLPAP